MYYIYNYNLTLCIYSPEEVYYTLKKNGYNKVKSVLHIDNKVFAVDQHCYDVLIFPSHLKSDLLNIDCPHSWSRRQLEVISNALCIVIALAEG